MKGKNFEKIKFAVVKRSQYSKPQYLNDSAFLSFSVRLFVLYMTPDANLLRLDDRLWNLTSSDDEFLALDHPDRSRSLRNGVGDLFLK